MGERRRDGFRCALVIAFLVGLCGCGSDCDTYARSVTRCGLAGKGNEAQSRKMCGAGIEANTKTQELALCAKTAGEDCDAFLSCWFGVTARYEANKLEQLAADKKWTDVSWECEQYRDLKTRLAPLMAPACKDLHQKGVAELGTEAKRLSLSAESKDELHKVCRVYLTMANFLSPADAAEARADCGAD